MTSVSPNLHYHGYLQPVTTPPVKHCKHPPLSVQCVLARLARPGSSLPTPVQSVLLLTNLSGRVRGTGALPRSRPVSAQTFLSNWAP